MAPPREHFMSVVLNLSYLMDVKQGVSTMHASVLTMSLKVVCVVSFVLTNLACSKYAVTTGYVTSILKVG